MHRRRRDALGRFIPLHSSLGISSNPSPDINPLAEAFVQARNKGIFYFSKGDLDFLNEPTKQNILPLVLNQGKMVEIPLGGGGRPPPFTCEPNL